MPSQAIVEFLSRIQGSSGGERAVEDAEKLYRTSNAEKTTILRHRSLFLAPPQARAVAKAKRQTSIIPLPPPNVWVRFMRSGSDMLGGTISAGFKVLGGGFNWVIGLISNHVKVTVDVEVEVEPRHLEASGPVRAAWIRPPHAGSARAPSW